MPNHPLKSHATFRGSPKPGRPGRSGKDAKSFMAPHFCALALACALLFTAPAHSQPGSILVWFATAADTSQIFYNEEPRFLIVVETAPASGRFIAEVNLKGVYGEPASGNGFIEIDGNSMNGETLVMDATAEVGAVTEMASLDLGFPGGDAIQPKARIARRRAAGTGVEAYTLDGRMLPRGMRSLPPGSLLIAP